MTLETLIEKLQELSREWRKADYSDMGDGEDTNKGLSIASEELDSLISQAQQPPTDTTP